MYALTLWQPWAHAIAFYGKRIENRTWPPPPWILGRRIAIHAGATLDAEAAEELRFLGGEGTMPMVTRAVVATVVVQKYLTTPDRIPADQRRWWSGPFAWILDDVHRIPPIPCSGKRKLWRLPPEVEAIVHGSEPDVSTADAKTVACARISHGGRQLELFSNGCMRRRLE